MKESLSYNEPPPYDTKTCNSTKHCKTSLKNLVEIWKRITNVVAAPQVKDLGSILANFNFLLEVSLDYAESKHDLQKMHQMVTDVISQVYPSWITENDIFVVDILGLLGYVTTFGLDKWKYDKVEENMEEISNLRGVFQQLPRKFIDLQDKITFYRNKGHCNLASLYHSWVQYLEDRNAALAYTNEGRNKSSILLTWGNK